MLARSTTSEMIGVRHCAEDRCCEEVVKELGTQLVLRFLQHSVGEDEMSLRLLFPPFQRWTAGEFETASP